MVQGQVGATMIFTNGKAFEAYKEYVSRIKKKIIQETLTEFDNKTKIEIEGITSRYKDELIKSFRIDEHVKELVDPDDDTSFLEDTKEKLEKL